MPERMATSGDSRLLGDWLRDSTRAVVFTGAGISTESGIPDFRSKDGLWSRYRPIEFSDFLSSAEARMQAWQRTLAARPVMNEARPNAGHEAIARLVQRGTVAHVITQNIDGLHQQSGVPGDRVIELHGNATFARCLDCSRRYELDEVLSEFEATGAPPRCVHCEGLVKTATISFGQPMPIEGMRRAEKATRSCDLFLAIGSSLVVYPAAGFPAMAKQHGARLIIINRDPTDLDPIADLVIHDEIGPTLAAAVSQ